MGQRVAAAATMSAASVVLSSRSIARNYMICYVTEPLWWNSVGHSNLWMSPGYPNARTSFWPFQNAGRQTNGLLHPIPLLYIGYFPEYPGLD